jgi:hypothetical protein
MMRRCLNCGEDMFDGEPHFCSRPQDAPGVYFKIDLVKVWQWWKRKRERESNREAKSEPSVCPDPPVHREE